VVISNVLLIYGRHLLGRFRRWHFLSKVRRLWCKPNLGGFYLKVCTYSTDLVNLLIFVLNSSTSCIPQRSPRKHVNTTAVWRLDDQPTSPKHWRQQQDISQYNKSTKQRSKNKQTLIKKENYLNRVTLPLTCG